MHAIYREKVAFNELWMNLFFNVVYMCSTVQLTYVACLETDCFYDISLKLLGYYPYWIIYKRHKEQWENEYKYVMADVQPVHLLCDQKLNNIRLVAPSSKAVAQKT